jgi:hypothetical protein
MYQRGAHGLYLFNWGHLLYGFNKDATPNAGRLGTVWYDELHPCYYEALRQIGEVQTMRFGNATYDLESIPHKPMSGEAGASKRQSRGINAIELPIEMTIGRHTMNLPCAEDLAGAKETGVSPRLKIRFRVINYTAPDEFEIRFNGQPIDPATGTSRSVFIMGNDTWFEYPLAPAAVTCGDNELAFNVLKLNKQMSVTPVLANVQLVVTYRS